MVSLTSEIVRGGWIARIASALALWILLDSASSKPKMVEIEFELSPTSAAMRRIVIPLLRRMRSLSCAGPALTLRAPIPVISALRERERLVALADRQSGHRQRWLAEL